jgi:hypothetical protein
MAKEAGFLSGGQLGFRWTGFMIFIHSEVVTSSVLEIAGLVRRGLPIFPNS